MKSLYKNIFFLGIVQGINLLIPLMVTPYLITTIGVKYFGIISTAQSVVLFFIFFTDFGFNITSVRRLAQNRNNKKEIESIINGVFFLKLILLFTSFILFFITISSVKQFRDHFEIYLFSFVMVIGQVFLPIWYYQGLEKIKKTIIPVVLFKIFNIALIFLLVHKENDAVYVNLFYGLGNILTGIVLYYYIIKDHRISIKYFNLQILLSEFKGSFAIFFSNIGVIFYSNSALIILSFYLDSTALGIYSIADKILQLLKALLSIIHQVTYPRLCKIIIESPSLLFSFIKQFYIAVWIGFLILGIFLTFKSTFFLSFFVKDPQTNLLAAHILKQLSFILFIISFNMPFFQTLLAYKKDWLIVKITIAGSFICIILNIVLISIFNIQGAIITIYIVEAFVTILYIFFMLKTIKNINQNKQLIHNV